MRKILVLFAHPAIHKSRVNRQLAQVAREIEGITFHDLYEAYPDLNIDINREQKLLAEHDLVVFQHPFYWYSTPAVMKEWVDIVLEYGWAYGEGGTALERKGWVHALSSGGTQEAYQGSGSNRFTIRQFLAPMDQSAHLCGMEFIPPFALHGVHRLDPRTEIPRAAEEYRRFLEILRDFEGEWSLIPKHWERVNPHLDELARLAVSGGKR